MSNMKIFVFTFDAPPMTNDFGTGSPIDCANCSTASIARTDA